MPTNCDTESLAGRVHVDADRCRAGLAGPEIVKNQYFGDINDYRKYGLLRCFVDAGFSLGVCWMLTPDTPNHDGQKTGYLTQPAGWRRFDPPLFDFLASRVGSGIRSVRELERSNLMSGARYCSEVCPDAAAARSVYMASALHGLSSADLLFFDPDNGLEVKSKPYGSPSSSKYLFWRDVEQAWSCGASLLIFQHYTRESRETLTNRLYDELSSRTKAALVAPIHTAHVLFLFCGKPTHVARFETAARIINERWAGQSSVAVSNGSEQPAKV